VETSRPNALYKNESIDIGLYSPFVFGMVSIMAVFQHFGNVKDVIAILIMCVMYASSLGTRTSKTLGCILLHLIL